MKENSVGSPFTIARGAVIAKAEVPAQWCWWCGFNTQGDHGFSGVTTEATHVAADLSNAAATYLYQRFFESRDMQHAAQKGGELGFNLGLEFFVAAFNL